MEGSVLLQFLITVLILGVPLWKILQKAGFSPWWSLLLLTGIGYYIVLALLAFGQWVDKEPSNV